MEYNPSSVVVTFSGKKIDFSVEEDIVVDKPRQETLSINVELKGFGTLSGSFELDTESLEVWNKYLESKE
jgi:hypothetical protein